MPWMPEVFSTPIADARRAQGEAMPTNDAVPYYEGIMANEPDALICSFAGPESTIRASGTWRVEGGYAPSFLGRSTGWASATRWWRT
jgi:hypothetical protein